MAKIIVTSSGTKILVESDGSAKYYNKTDVEFYTIGHNVYMTEKGKTVLTEATENFISPKEVSPSELLVLLNNILTSTTTIPSSTTLLTVLDSPYSVVLDDTVLFCDTTGGVIVVNLLAGVNGDSIEIINTGSSLNDVNVTPNGTEELFGAGAGVFFSLMDGESINPTFNPTKFWW